MSDSKKFPVEPHCPNCDSTELVGDGAVRWSVPDQEWELSSVYDSLLVCDDCGGEFRNADWREVEPELDWGAIVVSTMMADQEGYYGTGAYRD